MVGKRAAVRKLAACLVMIALVTAWPASGVYAQAAPAIAHPALVQKDQKSKNNNDNNSKNQKSKQAPQPSVYSRQAVPVLIGAFDRAMSEIDGAPDTLSPTDVKNATFRRRLLELRLLMDTDSFLYNHDQLQAYRDVVDAAY